VNKLVLGGILAATFAGSAMAADMPIKAPPPVVIEGGPYVWVDGFYEQMRLPSYNLGTHLFQLFPFLPPLADLGPLQTFDPRLNSGGVRGAIGYLVPGSAFRLELGGSYVSGSGSQSQSSTPQSVGYQITPLSGRIPAFAMLTVSH
jgi:hypothetical protein